MFNERPACSSAIAYDADAVSAVFPALDRMSVALRFTCLSSDLLIKNTPAEGDVSPRRRRLCPGSGKGIY